VKIVTSFPRAVREIPHLDIRLHDGTRIAARMWLPDDAERSPVPVILEYLPYRKGDGTAIDDATRHRYFAGHGFAAIRVDMRGSGDSEGLLVDEYSETELKDAVELIGWLASQPWCNGRVGMMGISWGGFNSLQVAALAPPALRAVISVCSTDDRYNDDVHYQGGAVLAREMLGWAMTMLGFNAKPPDPQVVGERWRELWQQRLDGTPAFIDAWMEHPHRDAYWRHGSICEDYSAIRCPVLMVGGWADGYTNTVMRVLNGLDVPCRGIIGPWAHQYPNAGRPGPAIGFLQEAVRWWDHWLNDRDRGVLDTPKLRVWMQRHTAPQSKASSGRWYGSGLASSEFERPALYLSGAALQPTAAPAVTKPLPSDPRHGAASGMWCPFGPGDLAGDQRPDDLVSMTFDSAPLDAELSLLGVPEVIVDAQGEPGAQVIARLCEITPDGSSLLLSWGVQTLDGDAQVHVRMNALGHQVKAGHRLRLALAASYWPMVWPSAAPPPNVTTGISRLVLPVWTPQTTSVAFEEPECAEPAQFEVLRKGAMTLYGDGTGRRADQGRIRHANGMEVETVFIDEMTWADDKPSALFAREFELARGDWQTRIAVTGEMTSDRDSFDVRVGLIASSGDARCADRTWTFRFPRRSA
jgi:putative CocE/NonD family hydrolase